jgi:hypothetical protein
VFCELRLALGDYNRLQRSWSTFRWGSLNGKTPQPESIWEHAFLGRRIGASLIAEGKKVRQSSASGVWGFDGAADKATRSLLRAIALRQRRDACTPAHYVRNTYHTGILFRPEIARLSECPPAEALAQSAARVAPRRFWIV